MCVPAHSASRSVRNAAARNAPAMRLAEPKSGC